MTIREWLARRLLKANPVAAAQIPRVALTWGSGEDWAPPNYGEYYAKSNLLYSALKLRADAVTRAPLRVYQLRGEDRREVPRNHPLAELLRKVNPYWTMGDIWRGTSIYRDIWGSAFWVMDRPSPGRPPSEIWLARPDRMRILGDDIKYIKGFVYQWQGRRINLLPEDVVWFRNFNPLDELSGFSPIAPLRLSLDMAVEALKYNRDVFRGMLPGSVGFEVPDSTTQEEIDEFERRLSERHGGSEKRHHALIYSAGAKPTNLGFSPREMEYIASLRWSLEEVSRALNVPKTMLGDLEHSTYANIDREEMIFWRAIASELAFYAGEINEMLAPQFGDDLVVEFDLSEVEALQEDINKVWERHRGNVGQGLVTINEARAEMNLAPVPWGDAWWASMTLLPVTSSTTPAEPEEATMLPRLHTADLGPNGYKLYPIPALSEAALDRVVEIHGKRLDRHQRRFQDMQKALWARQEKDVLRKLRASKSAEKQMGDLFVASAWLPVFKKLGLPVILAALSESAQGQIDQFGLGISFDVSNPVVQEFLATRTTFWANRVNEKTAELLMGEIREAQNLGESIPDIQKRVEKVFRFNDNVRSERIARTETQASMNRGSIEAYRQSGVVESKMWLTQIDGRERDAHRDVHGQTVPLDAPFLVGGESIMHPGEGSPENSINCRCAVNPVIGKAAKALPEPRRTVKRIKHDANGFPTEVEEIHYG